MNNFLKEETIHYAARFLERWADKNPTKEHLKMAEELRELSDNLIENLYNPTFITIVRAKKK